MSLKLFIDNAEIETSTFKYAGGEISTKIAHPYFSHFLENNEAHIVANLHSSDDVMELLMLTDALRQLNPKVRIHLLMPYVPYARQDRVCNAGEAMSIKVFCNLINSQNYDRVTIEDPHSDVTPALLDRCFVRNQATVFAEGAYQMGLPGKKGKDNIVLVSPDAGANKKVQALAQYMGIPNIVRADKKRDTATMKILETVVYSEHVGDKDFLIVDDIADGGRTFIELARVLRPLTNGKIILYVTHGIFSYGLDVFKGVIDEVYTANPWHPDSWGRFTNLLEKKDDRSPST